jgi:hypothetical protein
MAAVRHGSSVGEQPKSGDVVEVVVVVVVIVVTVVVVVGIRVVVGPNSHAKP